MSEPSLSVLPPVRAGVCADPDWMVGFCCHAEALGFESVVTVEHPLVVGAYESRYPYAESGRMPLPNDCAVPDPLDTLAFVAGATSTLGLATGVLIVPAHHPVVLAKRVATLDRLSKGRLRLCVGLGWMREELEACGADFGSRGRRTDESIDVMRLLWSDTGEQGASFDGEFFSFSGAHSYPKPATRPDGRQVPVHIGGHSAASVRRAARRGDGWHPLGLHGEDLTSRLKLLDDELERAGRHRSDLEVTLTGVAAHTDSATLEKVAALGVDRLVATCMQPGLGAAKDEIEGLAQRVGLRSRNSP
jgi:probable F420-dependent oxidoreductase